MTNPLCECPVAGYCKRHQMDKNETFHALCHGDRGQAGWKYFVAWESGKMGAVSPHDSNTNPPAFEGIPGELGIAKAPLEMREGMNAFLKGLGITFRRDEETRRPRVNKPESRLDRMQKEQGEYYYPVEES